MYRGMGITMVRAFIGKYSPLIWQISFKVNAVTFYGYEWMKDLLDK